MGKRLDKIWDMTDMPPADMEGWPRLTLLGEKLVTLEGHGEILDLSEQRLTVQWMHGTVTVEGKGLILKELSAQGLTLEGEVRTVKREGGHGL